jgi:hypothetical protein
MEKNANEELRNLYASPNIITVIKSRRMRLGVYSTHGIYICVCVCVCVCEKHKNFCRKT